MIDTLELMKRCSSIKKKNVIQRMRGKFKTKYYDVKKDDFIEDLKAFSDKNGNNFSKEDCETFIKTLEEFFFAYANEALKNKISYQFEFLDDLFCVDFYDKRMVRNPAENKEFESEPKVQFKFLNKRMDDKSLKKVELYD